jgi:glucokinase
MPPVVFAADLGGTKLACAVVDLDGKILARRTESVDTSSPRAPIAQIVRLAGELRGRRKYSAAGIAVPGLARRDGTVWAPNLPGWERMPLARLLRAHLKIPVVVDSDRNAVVLGETWRGAARGMSDVIVLIVGTGIGAGILSGGRLIRGAHELSGCAGWLCITDDESALARKIGSLEASAAGPAVARIANLALKKRALRNDSSAITTEHVADLARAGDRTAREIFRAAGHLLGLGVANLISLFDPEVVVLTGGLSYAADLFLDELASTALSRCQPLIAGQVKIRVSRLQAKANLLGAAKLALENEE